MPYWEVTLLDTFNGRTRVTKVPAGPNFPREAKDEDEAAALAVNLFPKFKFIRAEQKEK
jgi:hypothetical protein